MLRFSHDEIFVLVQAMRLLGRITFASEDAKLSAIEKLEDYAQRYHRANDPGTGQPRRAPEPCDPDCPGWAIFDEGTDRCGIARCDSCWCSVPDPERLDDADYECHPICQSALDDALNEADLEWQ